MKVHKKPGKPVKVSRILRRRNEEVLVRTAKNVEDDPEWIPKAFTENTVDHEDLADQEESDDFIPVFSIAKIFESQWVETT